MNDGAIFKFVIHTEKQLSMSRIAEYMILLEKMLGVPAKLSRIEQDEPETPPPALDQSQGFTGPSPDEKP
jgi:hypothetical protein